MFKQIALLSALFVQTLAWGYNVNVRYSWINLALDSENIYVEKVGLEQLPRPNLIPVISGEDPKFKALVPPGHEVTKWSYMDYTDENALALLALSNSAFQNEISTSSDSVSVTPEKSNIALAVHLDWLKYDLAHDGNGATSGSAPTLKDVIYTNKVTLAANPFSKTGYSFKNWQMKESPDRTFVDQAKVTGESFGLSYTNKSVTLVAQWTNNEYVVTFDANGGAFADGSSVVQLASAYDDKYVLPKENPTRDEYAFAGWTNSVGQVVTAETVLKTTSDHTLYAKWQSAVLTVSFNSNGGTQITDTKKYVVGNAYSNLPVPERYGYSYGGAWWTQSSGGEPVTGETKVTKAGTQTLYAHWTANQCTVSFDSGVLTDITPSFISKAVTFDTPYGNLPDISCRGYEFTGWFTGKNAGQQVSEYSSVKIADDHTLYAHWIPISYFVNYDPAGGTVSKSREYITFGEPYPVLVKPERAGYTFVGWFTKSEGGDEVRQGDYVNIVQEETPTLYARWTTNEYTIVFDPNGGTGDPMESIQIKYNEVTNLPPCTYSNGIRAFSGWRGSDGKTFADRAVVSNLTAEANGVYTLTAMWSEEYVISFDGNGATSGEMSDQTLSTTETASLNSNRYVRTGYAYLGWATNETTAAEWKVRFTDGATVCGLGSAGETIRLFAVWTNNPYRVRFYPNGGAGNPFEQSFAYDVAQNLPGEDVFTRDGYELVGWLTDPTNAVAFTAGESAVNLSDEAGAVVPLFAKWKSLGEDLGPYSEAADCAIATSDRDALRLTAGSYCTTVTNVTTAPGANDQCICLCPTVNGMTTAELRSIVLRGYGKFSFDYKAVIRYGGEDPEVSNFTCGIEEGGQDESLVDLKSSSDGWKHVEYDKRTEGDATVEWIFKTFYNDEDSDMVFIDNVAWLPEDRNLGTAAVTFRLNDGTVSPADIWSNATFAVGKAIGMLPVLPDEDFIGWSTNGVESGKIDANWIVPVEDTQLCALWDSGEYPVPGPEDAPAIGGFESTADGFSLSFTSDERFDYRVLSTTSLTPPIVWEPDAKMRLDGTGGTLTFQIPVGEGTDPARFFKVEVLPREAK